TTIGVPLLWSGINHWGPRTVADAFRPRVRKDPCTLLKSLRERFRAAPPFGSGAPQPPSPPPVSDICASPPLRPWPTRNWPPLKLPPPHVGLVRLVAVMRRTAPWVGS